MKSIKNANTPIKLAGILIFLALMLYMGCYSLSKTRVLYDTEQVVAMTVRESCDTTGIVIREEQLLTSACNTVHITASEGKRVAGGQIVAEAFDTEEGLRIAVEIAELAERIQSLEEQQYRNSTNMDMLRLDKDIWNACVQLRSAALRRDFSALEEDTLTLQTLSFTAFSDSAEIDTQLSSYRSRLNELQAKANSNSAGIYAPASGLFSTALDGLEGITPDSVSNITVDQLNSLLETAGSDTSFALGKLVYGSRWYYAALLDAEDAGRLRLNGTAKLYLGRYYTSALTVRVEWISNMSDGKQAVLFSCGSNMSDILSVRKQDAELIFREEEGFRVPRTAIHMLDGQAVVYIKTGLRAELKQVEVLYDYDDYYVVASTELRSGDAVITKGKELSDGKVIG